MTKEVLRGNEAAALGAKLCKPNVIPAYPITPSTLFPERMSEYIADGELDAEFVLVESEHSAMSAAIGASATGARVVTATASQGLELMHEMLFIASGMRLPIMMAIGNRAVAAPINIWADHQDTISARDCGWLQFYAEKNQETLDLMIMVFKIGEDKRVLLPAMVGMDAFVLTHTMEAVDVPDQEAVDDFVGVYNPDHVYLDPKRPITIGSFAPPDVYQEFKYAQYKAMMDSEKVVDEVFADFEKRFGRHYQKVTGFQCEDADVIIVTMGSMTGTARAAVKKMREEGKKVGLLKITMLRPFPKKEIIEVTRNTKVLAVLDRSLSLGLQVGPVHSEIAAAYINESKKPMIMSFVTGLGGRDILIENIEEVYERAMKALEEGGPKDDLTWIHLREEIL